MNFENEMRERMKGVEVGIGHLTSLLEDHVNKDCDGLGCVLHDDVMSLKKTQKNIRRITWATITSAILAGLTFIFGRITHVG